MTWIKLQNTPITAPNQKAGDHSYLEEEEGKKSARGNPGQDAPQVWYSRGLRPETPPPVRTILKEVEYERKKKIMWTRIWRCL